MPIVAIAPGSILSWFRLIVVLLILFVKEAHLTSDTLAAPSLNATVVLKLLGMEGRPIDRLGRGRIH
jgi:hypothetical protein